MLFRPKNFGCTKFVQSKFHSVEAIENIESEFGGASRDRTDDLIVANDALSQLSYSPTVSGFTNFISLRRARPQIARRPASLSELFAVPELLAFSLPAG